MSEPKLTKKQKKAAAFRERKGSKGKGKAREEPEDNDVPLMEDQDAAEVEGGDTVVAPPPSGAKPRQDVPKVVEGKKRKRGEDGPGVDEGDAGKGKKRKKEKVEKLKDADVEEGKDEEGVEDGEAKPAKSTKAQKNAAKQQRFILFVGNLKYTTTKEAIQAHFAECNPPPTIRLMTPKPTPNGRPVAKSKGCAFLEFSAKSGLQQALKLHQSQLEGRLINVELTAGGGGKSEGRMAKLKERNKELHEQRKRRLEKGKDTNEVEAGVADLERPQRYSATSGVVQAPTKKRTWTIPEGTEEPAKKKRGKRPQKALGTGVNAIPVG